MPRTRRGLPSVAAACLLALLAAGCTPSTPPPASPSPTSTAPTETTQEREERLAYEAAETSYREFRAEYRRLESAGGTDKATEVMKRTAGGPYLSELLGFLKDFKTTESRAVGEEHIGYIHRMGYSPQSVLLTACEDDSHVRTLDKNEKTIDKGDFLIVKLEARLVDDSWKIWSGTGESAKSCDE